MILQGFYIILDFFSQYLSYLPLRLVPPPCLSFSCTRVAACSQFLETWCEYLLHHEPEKKRKEEEEEEKEEEEYEEEMEDVEVEVGVEVEEEEE